MPLLSRLPFPPAIITCGHTAIGCSTKNRNSFYSHNLKIGNSIDNTIVSNIEYQKEDEAHYTAKVKFASNTQEAFKNTTVHYRYIENGKVKDKGKRKTDESGLISISLPDLKPTATRHIEVEFDDPQYIYKKTFYLPSFNKDFNVQFFPEGGALLAVAHQNIAFKVQGTDGFSKEIEGFLFDAKGDTLTAFRSEHDGMGVFTLNPTNGNSYYVIAKTNDGISKRFDLPAVEQKESDCPYHIIKRKYAMKFRKRRQPNGRKSYF